LHDVLVEMNSSRRGDAGKFKGDLFLKTNPSLGLQSIEMLKHLGVAIRPRKQSKKQKAGRHFARFSLTTNPHTPQPSWGKSSSSRWISAPQIIL